MKQLLVCIDGSQYATSCCRYAGWLAKRLDCRIELVYVTDLRQFEAPFVADLSGSLGIQPFQAVMGQLQALEEKKAELVLSQGEDLLRESGYGGEVLKTHKTGFLVDCLNELEQSSDFIVIGKRGENANFATEHLGSTMERVARAAVKPCFVASRSFDGVKKIAFAYQSVSSCHSALNFLKSHPLADGLELHVITVAPSEEEATALDILKEAEIALGDSNIDARYQMLHGIPSQAISCYVKDNAIDMLVMGAYGHSRIRRLVIGSFTTEMLRDCRKPILMFR
ncbi:MAG: universal stress protein [Verrucomicrobiota bacterium]